MNFIGIDLHKQTISVCVKNQERKVLKRQSLNCAEPGKIVAFFREWGEFQAVVEATASYEWLWQLLEPLAQRLVLAHPKKLRVIGTPFSQEPYGVGLGHDDKALREAITNSLEAHEKNGDYKAAYDATLGLSGSPFTPPPALDRY